MILRIVLWFCILHLSIIEVSSQQETLFNTIDPTGLFKDCEQLYIGTYEDAFFNYNLNETNSLEQLFVIDAFRMARHNDDLYITTPLVGIYRLDLNNGSLDLLLTQEESVAGIAIFEDTLFYSEWYSGIIRQVDLSETDPTSKIFLSGLDTLNAMVQHDGELYFIENRTGGIFKKDLTSANSPIDTLFYEAFNSPNELHVLGGYMYVSEFIGNKITRFRIDDDNPSLEVVVQNILSPTGLASDDKFLYASSFNGNRVVRIPHGLLLSTRNFEQTKTYNIYPNPSNGILNIEGMEKAI